MKNILLLAILCCLCVAANAQVPGYMGKKHLFIYTPSVSLYSNEYRLDNTNPVSLFFLKHNVAYQYVIKKRKSIGVFYEYSGFKSAVGGYNDRFDNFRRLTGNFKKHHLGFTYRKYFNTYNLAPLGAYMKYTLSGIRATTTMDDQSVRFYENVLDFNQDYVVEKKTWDIAVGIGIGRQFVIAKYIPLNMEVDFHLPFTYYSYFASANQLVSSHATNLIGSTLINFNVGIGILAF